MGAYIALIGDLKSSRRVKNRADLQAALRDSLDRLNRDLGGALASRFLITVGDEFQGLFQSADPIAEAIFRLWREVPGDMRFGIGAGDLTTSPQFYAIGSDGPVWYAARDALERAGKRAPVIDRHGGFGDPANQILDGLLAGFRRVSRSMSARQIEVAYRLLRGESVSEIAAQDGLSRSAVHKSALTGGYAEWRELEAGLTAMYRSALAQSNPNL